MAELIVTLAAIGYLMGNKIANNSNAIPNMFNDNSVNVVDKEMKKKAMNKFSQSKSPSLTGVIPKYYNNNNTGDVTGSDMDSQFSETEPYENSQRINRSSELDRCDDLTNNGKYESRVGGYGNGVTNVTKGGNVGSTRVHQPETFNNQFDQLKFDTASEPAPFNAVGEIIGDNGAAKRTETECKLALNEGFSNFDRDTTMTYGVGDEHKLSHNNMVPQVKSKIGYDQTYKENQINQRKLELFTGDVKQADYEHKVESAPRFSPVLGFADIYGMPNMSQFYESRYMPSKERRGEKPFEPVRVTPGVGLNYNEQATFGYHDPFRVMPKTVDELRPKNKPKISYTTPVVMGQRTNNRPIQGKVVKRKPPKCVEQSMTNVHPNYFNVGGMRTREKYEVENIATQNRGVTANGRSSGGATFAISQSAPWQAIGKNAQPKRQNFTQAEPRNIQIIEGMQARPETSSYQPHTTQRCTKQDYLGPAGNSTLHMAVNYCDTPQMTGRSIINKYDRAGQISGNMQKNTAFNPDDVMNTTLRDVHNTYDRAGQVSGNMYKNTSFNPNDTTNTTLREVHNTYDRAGQVSGNMYKNTSFNPTDVTNTTLREVHNTYDRAGQVTGNMQKNVTYNPNDIMDITLRDIHNTYDRAGQVTGNMQKNVTFNPSDVPDITSRNMYNYSDVGGMKSYVEKNKTIDYKDVPDITSRNMYNYSDVGGMKSCIEKNKTINYNDIPDVTEREMHNYDDVAPARGIRMASRGRNDANNAQLNAAREALSKGRTFTQVGCDLGPSIDVTGPSYDLSDKTHTSRKMYPGTIGIPSNDTLESTSTHCSKYKVYYNDAEDAKLVKETLEGNPYVNNILYKSV